MTRKMHHTLHDYVQLMLKEYFENLGDEIPSHMYAMTMNEVEKALLNSVLMYTHNNQSIAAKYLGLTRSTLRKKLRAYDLYPND